MAVNIALSACPQWGGQCSYKIRKSVALIRE